MQRQMERLVLENRELEEELSMALKERKVMEEILDEMEEEHDDAFARITLLETQLKALKLENMRINEHRGKSMWDKKPPAAAHGKSLPASTRPSNTRKRKDREDEAEEATAAAQEEEGGGGGVAAEVTTEEEESVQMRRGKAVARRRSLISLGMSAAVGAVVVARFFFLRESAALRGGRPASSSDAAALLSLNWFLLGVLTSPMLPGAAHAVFPRAARLVGPAVAWFSATAPLPS
uniref:Uncharacterized protein n=1 Tax=Oryza punctata TaxID=4537 RepID=A0A0E0JTY6_ORYPU